jgi:CRISPR-associated endonuclease/helicase Cas3
VNLATDDFPSLFQALWGYEPFPWQTRLARQVCASGWPEALDLPTASGKTATIDIALFHLAVQADKGPERKAPMRIVFVVDRRLVVDGAYERAKCIARKLVQAERGILKDVADRLRSFAGEAEPLGAVRLRGGTPMEPDWVKSPAHPTVVVSTVDQVGSRLLFRGYGVSDSMRPVHAGLLGSDALFLLDEAHLSQPFVETLGWVQRYRAEGWVDEAPGPFAAVYLSATLPPGESVPFALDDSDRRHHELRPRLIGHKPAALKTARAKFDDVKGLADDFADAAKRLAKADATASLIAVVVNRVGLARAIHASLTQMLKSDDGLAADATLLIGRSRPLDRERQLMDVLPRMAAGRSEDQVGRLFVVATQCIEAGADLDFDALVTQIAPLDCLRQRFGRLDRLGRRQRRGLESHATILAASDEVGKKAEDPIYGTAPRATWDWLQQKADSSGKDKIVRFGVEAIEDLLYATRKEDATKTDSARVYPTLLARRASAPVFLPVYVDAFAQTWPAPGADPEPSMFLHGPDADRPDVQIVWRADLDGADWVSDHRTTHIVALCPPSVLESVTVSFSATKHWLAAVEPSAMADVEGAPEHRDHDRGERGRFARLVVRWRGSGSPETRMVGPQELRSGDLVIVPVSYGGCDRFGWHPESMVEVPDAAFEAALRHRRRLVLRLHPAVLTQDLARDESAENSAGLWRRIADLLEQHQDDKSEMLAALAGCDGLPLRWRDALGLLAASPNRVVIDFPYGDSSRGAVLTLRRQLVDAEVRRLIGDLSPDEETADAATEDDTGSFLGVPVELLQHCSDVEKLARCFARAAALAPERVADIALAARLHDLGKAEPRFQTYLHGGDELAWLSAARSLAKSGERATREAAIRARMPRGPGGEHARHECWSVRLAERHPELARASDPELVLWLIGTHHGRGRPFFPPILDDEAEGSVTVELTGGVRLEAPVEHGLTSLDSGWIERFERLKRRYGPWELARMEATLRLADHRASATAGRS